ncbi:hypothetical protein C1H46_008365 [Malus baccata]|uniref:Uncharacterized protein n=1 Tax=Malus baccata TaxID=106549 RepID=A0A540N4T2_MALBA|nr:hypothetical protein C1H46_008365 [Malus baccata]
MRNDSKRHWKNPCSESYNPKLKKHLEQYFEQFNVPQELSVEDNLSKLLESTELYIEITNEGFLIQALNYGKSFNDQEEIGVGTEEQSTTHSRPGEKATHADPIIAPEPSTTHVYVPPKPFPQSLQEDMSVNMLGEVHTNLTSNMSHDQLSNTLINLDTGQMTTVTIYVAELDDPTVQAFKLKENLCKSYEQAMIYKGRKKKLSGSPILHHKIHPMQKLWVLNTRLKLVHGRHKPRWKGLYLVSKTNSHKRVDKKDSTNEFKCTVQVNPYLLLLYDAVKAWLTLKEQML